MVGALAEGGTVGLRSCGTGWYKLGLGIVLGMALAGGVAYATIPGAGGVISACYKNRGGDLRVIDAAVATCDRGETLLTWNQSSPPSPRIVSGTVNPGTSGTGTGFAYNCAGSPCTVTFSPAFPAPPVVVVSPIVPCTTPPCGSTGDVMIRSTTANSFTFDYFGSALFINFIAAPSS